MSKQGYVEEAIEWWEIPFKDVPCHTETKQSLCNENQLTGFCPTQVFIESNFRTNSNLN